MNLEWKGYVGGASVAVLAFLVLALGCLGFGLGVFGLGLGCWRGGGWFAADGLVWVLAGLVFEAAFAWALVSAFAWVWAWTNLRV